MAGESPREDLLSARTRIWNLSLDYVNSMSLMVAVQLGIPDAIHGHGGPICVSLLATAVGIPDSKVPALGRLMRALAHCGVLHRDVRSGEEGKEAEEVYSPTILSQQLLKDGATTAAPFFLLLGYPLHVSPWYSMAAWFRGEGAPHTRTAFEGAYGETVCRSTGHLPEYNDVFNKAMACDSRWSVGIVAREYPEVFQGLAPLVDVGGGIGTAAKAIKDAFPEMKCIVLELPHVVAASPAIDGIDFVAGDMFEHVPPADAVLLKWVLHAFDDGDCLRILERCKGAIVQARKHGGKVIIMEMLMKGGESDGVEVEVQHQQDLLMLAITGGRERNEREWRRILAAAGFSGCRITQALGPRSVIEAYL